MHVAVGHGVRAKSMEHFWFFLDPQAVGVKTDISAYFCVDFVIVGVLDVEL